MILKLFRADAYSTRDLNTEQYFGSTNACDPNKGAEVRFISRGLRLRRRKNRGLRPNIAAHDSSTLLSAIPNQHKIQSYPEHQFRQAADQFDEQTPIPPQVTALQPSSPNL